MKKCKIQKNRELTVVPLYVQLDEAVDLCEVAGFFLLPAVCIWVLGLYIQNDIIPFVSKLRTKKIGCADTKISELLDCRSPKSSISTVFLIHTNIYCSYYRNPHTNAARYTHEKQFVNALYYCRFLLHINYIKYLSVNQKYICEYSCVHFFNFETDLTPEDDCCFNC